MTTEASNIIDREDTALVARAREGDQAAFQVLVERYQADLCHLARNLVSSVDDAEDLTAEAFVKAWQHLKGFKGEASFKTWLWRILINLSRSHLRRRYLQKKIFFWRTFTGHEDDDYIREPEWVDRSHHADPEKVSEQKNIQQVVQWARKSLSMREEEVFTLKYDKGLKISEIAPLLSISENTVKVLLFRASRKMAAVLKDYER